MGMPEVTITFSELAATAIERGERGIIAMILKEESVPEENPITITSVTDIPEGLSAKNQEQIKLALMGYQNAPLRILVYVLDDEVANYTDALNYFKTVNFDYLVVPTVATDNKTSDIVAYAKAERGEKKLFKAVLPNVSGDHECIINFATANVIAGDKTYTTEEYCARIAGLLAGTPLTMSATYAPLPELTDCTRLTKSERDSAVDAGKFIVWFDGEKVKTGRAVNSLTTLSATKNTQYQKIHIVDVIDMMSKDMRMTIEDNYIGKYNNSYDNKCLLVSAIGSYFDSLIAEGVLANAVVEIDIDANRRYLKGRGENVDALSEQDIKEANTGSNVFLKATVSILDAIEDVTLLIEI